MWGCRDQSWVYEHFFSSDIRKTLKKPSCCTLLCQLQETFTDYDLVSQLTWTHKWAGVTCGLCSSSWLEDQPGPPTTSSQIRHCSLAPYCPSFSPPHSLLLSNPSTHCPTHSRTLRNVQSLNLRPTESYICLVRAAFQNSSLTHIITS